MRWPMGPIYLLDLSYRLSLHERAAVDLGEEAALDVGGAEVELARERGDRRGESSLVFFTAECAEGAESGI